MLAACSSAPAPRRGQGRALRRALPLRPPDPGADRRAPARRRRGAAAAGVPARPGAGRQRVERQRRVLRGAALARLARARRRVPERRRPLLLPRPPLRRLGALRARRGDPAGGRALRRRPAIAWRSAGSRWAASGRSPSPASGPSRFCAVGGHSAAFWQSSGETAPGAFDNAADFSRNDLIRLARARGRKPWGDARLWLDGGTADPFRAADERLAAALHIRMRHWAGGHDGNYWRATTSATCASTPTRSRPADLAGRERPLSRRRRRRCEWVCIELGTDLGSAVPLPETSRPTRGSGRREPARHPPYAASERPTPTLRIPCDSHRHCAAVTSQRIGRPHGM